MQNRIIQPFSLTLIMTLLVFCSSHALAFDPDAALKKQQEQEEAETIRENKALYQRYRGKAPVQINNDGTVTTGRLQWMRCSLGQRWDGEACLGDVPKYKWRDATDLPGLMNAEGGFAGHTDWRLPTFEELASLRKCSSGTASFTVTLNNGQKTFKLCVGDDYGSPKIDNRAFPNTPTDVVYWSATTLDRDPDYAGAGGFSRGSVLWAPKTGNAGVRLVRAEQ